MLFAALLGAAAVWFVGQPAEPDAPTHSGELTLSLKETEPSTNILLYVQVASRTSRISSALADELGEDFYETATPTVEVIEASLSMVSDPDVGTLQLSVINQPTEEAAVAVLSGFGRELVEYARERRTLERDESVAALEVREASLLTRIDVLTGELERAEAAQSQEDRDRGIDPDRVKTAQLASTVGILTGIQEDLDALNNRTEEQLTPLRLIGTPDTTATEVVMSPLDFGQRLAIGVLLAALLGIGLAFALHRFDSRLFSRKDTEAAFGLPVLTEIPKIRWWKRRKSGVLTRTEPGSLVAESFRVLRSSLAHTRMLQLERLGRTGDTSGTVTLVSSVAAGTGKTTVVANLAVAAVDAGKSVLVVSGDLREPKIHELLEADETDGITDAVKELQTSGQLNLDQYLATTGIGGVSLLAHGAQVPNPGETLALIRPLLDAVRARYDVILIDTPPMLVGNDVNELVPFADLMLLVGRAGKTTIDEAEWAEETAARLEAPTCGVALVGARSELERRDKSLFARLTGRGGAKGTRAESSGDLAPTPRPVESAVVVADSSPKVSAPVTAVAGTDPAVTNGAQAPAATAVPAQTAPVAAAPTEIVYPGGAPAATPAQPVSGTAANGNGAHPANGAAAQPAAPAAQPNGAPAQPTAPVAERGTPPAQPNDAAAQPATPAAQPGTPAAQPATPAAQPGTPAAQPATPAAQPAAPGAQPGTPAGQPGTPAAQPAAPGAQPGTPAGQPGAPAVQAGAPAQQPSGTSAQAAAVTATVAATVQPTGAVPPAAQPTAPAFVPPPDATSELPLSIKPVGIGADQPSKPSPSAEALAHMPPPQTVGGPVPDISDVFGFEGSAPAATDPAETVDTADDTAAFSITDVDDAADTTDEAESAPTAAETSAKGETEPAAEADTPAADGSDDDAVSDTAEKADDTADADAGDAPAAETADDDDADTDAEAEDAEFVALDEEDDLGIDFDDDFDDEDELSGNVVKVANRGPGKQGPRSLSA